MVMYADFHQHLFMQPLVTTNVTLDTKFTNLNTRVHVLRDHLGNVKSYLQTSTDPLFLDRKNWNYLVSIQFDGYDSNSGKLYVNNVQIFDSYATGRGTNRVTTAWGVVPPVDVVTGSTADGPRLTTALNLTGSGNIRIKGTLKIDYVRIRK